MNVAAFLPIYVESHYPTIKSTSVGILMSMFAISELLTCPFVGYFIDKIGRKNLFSFGILMNVISNVLFASASYSSTASVYLTISFIARSMSGIGDAFILICSPSMICTAYPKEKDIYMGYFVMSLSFAMLIGPLIGSIIYSSFGYTGTFYMFALCLFITWIYSIKVIPEDS